ncbi:MAG: polyprenyl synthetase family protein [Mariprofundaceae bacterium]|nr:polyprenyl synthetase family protein [Mariprofundaceae bacterium]
MLETRLQHHADTLNTGLGDMLDARREQVAERLWQAMRYSLLADGKRVRPAMMFECFTACGGKADILPATMSIECMHTYSLIHDDLPCMDDDDLRRGRPTCHRHFDEATAILAADALQSLSFELLGEQPTAAAIRLELMHKLAVASGASGMVGGQMLDMLAEAANIPDVEDVQHIHTLKTGALLRYCCEAGALLAEANATRINACSRYGQAVGLLFQIADDMLDATASSQQLGKSAGKDAAQHKATYVSLLGLARTREYAEQTHAEALEAAAILGEHGNILKNFATYILERRR